MYIRHASLESSRLNTPYLSFTSVAHSIQHLFVQLQQPDYVQGHNHNCFAWQTQMHEGCTSNPLHSRPIAAQLHGKHQQACCPASSSAQAEATATCSTKSYCSWCNSSPAQATAAAAFLHTQLLPPAPPQATAAAAFLQAQLLQLLHS